MHIKHPKQIYNSMEQSKIIDTLETYQYPHYQKIAYAVFMASRKLRHYFQECSIMVASKVPLNDIINNRDAAGRIDKWAIELLPFEIIYKPRWAIKSQVLADFVAEWTEAELPKEYGTYSNWVMHFDGSKMLADWGLVSSWHPP